MSLECWILCTISMAVALCADLLRAILKELRRVKP